MPKKKRGTRHAIALLLAAIPNGDIRAVNWTSSVVARRNRADDMRRNKTEIRTQSRNGENFEVGSNERVHLRTLFEGGLSILLANWSAVARAQMVRLPQLFVRLS